MALEAGSRRVPCGLEVDDKPKFGVLWIGSRGFARVCEPIRPAKLSTADAFAIHA